jgi:hypothetical protein
MRVLWKTQAPYGYETSPPEKGIRTYPDLRGDAATILRHWTLGTRLFSWSSIGAYLVGVYLTESLLVAVAGGTALVLLRLHSLESTLFERLLQLPEIVIDTHAHSQVFFEARFARIEKRLKSRPGAAD